MDVEATKTLFKVADNKGINGSEIGRRIGVTRATINYMKKGSNITIENFLKIAEAIGCDVILEDKETGLRYKL